MRDNVRVSDVPQHPVTRAAKMARLPIGLAGRTALGVGKRIGGRPAEMVAEEIQYPGAGRALIGDFNQLARAGRLFGLLMPGLDVKPLLEELKDRVAEELNYELEAMSQQMFADAYADDQDIYVPNVVLGT